MTNDSAREKLLDLLDRKAFDPLLNASPSAYTSERDKENCGMCSPVHHSHIQNRLSHIFLMIDVVTRDTEARDKLRGVQ